MDGILPIRRAILTALKADAGVTARVPASGIHPQSPLATPAWPFIRYGSPVAVPIAGSCIDGAEIAVALHGFAKPVAAADIVTLSAEDHAAGIGAAIKQALNRRRIDVAGLGTLRIRWTGSQLMPDGDEAEAYHAVVNFRVRLIA